MSDRRVFVSHDERDRPKAEEIVSFIEARGVPAWLASRNAEPGSDYSEQIEDAIAVCSGFVVVVSEGSSSSREVKGETYMAFRRGKPIFPVRFDDIDAGKGLRLYLAVTPWTDAFGPRREQNLERLANALSNVRGAIDRAERSTAVEDQPQRDRGTRTKVTGPASPAPSFEQGIVAGRRSSELIAYIASVITILTFLFGIRNGITSAISMYGIWALGFLVSSLFLYVIYSAYNTKSIGFAITDVIYTFPIFGKIARYSRRSSYNDTSRYYDIQKTLFLDYIRHVWILPQRTFYNSTLYLRKALDLGRIPLPAYAIFLLGFLVCIESLGISYLIGSATLPDEGLLRGLLLIGIVAVLASILAWVMHAAGHQLFRTGVLRNCFEMFQAERGPYLTSSIISLLDDQTLDDREPAYVQCANRTINRPGDLGSYVWVWLACLLVLSCAIALTMLRIETFDSQPEIAELFAVPEQSDEWSRSQVKASATGFAILAMVFVVTQCVALALGFWYGFSGRESRQAYVMTRGHTDFTSYSREARRRVQIAELRLTMLQRRLERRMPGIHLEMSIMDFIREERAQGMDLPDPCDLGPADPRSQL